MRPQVVIVATLLLNASLFSINLVVALLSGSRAVLSQAIYTVTDLVGSAFLLWGLYLSRRAADYDRPFGHGRERFFWAFVSIVVTFTVAGLLALTVGFEQIVTPEKITHIGYGLIVVGGTVLASIAGIYVTLRELRHSRETLASLLASANQGLKSIFYQDLVAIVGAIAAFIGLLIVYRTGDDVVDGLTAVVEGMILVAAGVVLSAESREYPRRPGPPAGRHAGDPLDRGARPTGLEGPGRPLDAPRPRRRPPRAPHQLPGRPDDRPDRADDRPGDGRHPSGPTQRAPRGHRAGVVGETEPTATFSRRRATVSPMRPAETSPKKT